MMIQHPLASDLARTQFLYRLPLTRPAGRLLVVGGASVLKTLGWPSDYCNIESSLDANASKEIEEPAKYSAIAIPAIINPFSNTIESQGNSDYLAKLFARLTPGGVIVGHMNNGLFIGNIAQPAKLRVLLAAIVDAKCPNTPKRLNFLLRAAGFTEVECFYVQPSIESPMALIPCVSTVSDSYFKRYASTARTNQSAASYWGRRMAVRLGLGGVLRNSIFFWGRHP